MLAGEADRGALGRRTRSGYQVGNFPIPLERSGTTSTAPRCATSGARRGASGDFASAVHGSSDLYQSDGRRPFASINFVTAHDGFTLNDLVSYNEKHNEANLEDNRDGTDDNRSWNRGVEGPTDDSRSTRFEGTPAAELPDDAPPLTGRPMLLGGDELGRSQGGTASPVWCQDSEISWFAWELDEAPAPGPVRPHGELIALRKAHPIFRRRVRLSPAPTPRGWGLRRHLVVPPGRAQDDPAGWGRGAGTIGVFLRRQGDPRAHPGEASTCVDDSFLLLFNAQPSIHVQAAGAAVRRALGAPLDALPGRRTRGTSGGHGCSVTVEGVRSCCRLAPRRV